jgi:two-component system, chemotaxis family, protein-glutamate methylesterase/glutaminase
MRKIISDILKSSPEIEVVGTARDGIEAIALAAKLVPDVITLDVEMPGKSGLEILPTLLATHNPAVIMLSSFAHEGANVTLAALELGAIDFLPKPDRITRLREDGDLLIAKIHAAAQSRSRRRTIPHRSMPSPVATPSRTSDTDIPVRSTGMVCVLIGISAGGPQALSQVLPRFATPIPPILVVQHMPAQFTQVFAERLDRACAFTVKEAEDGDKVLPGRILIAPGGRHLAVTGQASNALVALSDDPPVSGHRPSIDVLFHTAARVFRSQTVGVLMTGMGRDGVDGCKTILAAGGITFGQDEATSAVYGMNKLAMAEGAISSQFPLEGLPALIRRFAPDR